MNYLTEIIKAIFYGLIEGITEWLPISSTGHMILFGQFFGFETTQGKDFTDFFLVIVQIGAILAVVLSFFKELWPFGKKKSKEQKKDIWFTWLKILIASIPAGIIGFLLDDLLTQYLYNFLTVSITLILYGIVFLVIEYFLKKKEKDFNLLSEEDKTTRSLFKVNSVSDISIKYALIIGAAQCLALIPGTSRSGITICAALLLSINRETSAKFSFYLSIPAMLGGSLIKGLLYAIHVKNGTAAPISGFQITLIFVAMVVAFYVSIIVIKKFMSLLKSHTFRFFGIYRIVLGGILITFFILTCFSPAFKNQATASLQTLQQLNPSSLL